MFKSRTWGFLSALLALALLTACVPIATVTGSGRLLTRDMDLAGFSKVDASNAFQIEISQGTGYTVSVTADDNIWNQLDVRTEADTLRLGLRQPSLTNRVTLRARISLPALNGLNLSGASSASLTGVKATGDARAELSGASRVEGDWAANNLDLTLSGASQASLRGTAGNLSVDGSGASRAELSDFSVDKATVSLSGASRAAIKVNNSLDYDLSGASNLTYTGNPTIGRSQTSGASSAGRP